MTPSVWRCISLLPLLCLVFPFTSAFPHGRSADSIVYTSESDVAIGELAFVRDVRDCSYYIVIRASPATASLFRRTRSSSLVVTHQGVLTNAQFEEALDCLVVFSQRAFSPSAEPRQKPAWRIVLHANGAGGVVRSSDLSSKEKAQVEKALLTPVCERIRDVSSRFQRRVESLMNLEARLESAPSGRESSDRVREAR